jgi:hypothetical protein
VLADGREATVEQRYMELRPVAYVARIPILLPSFRLMVTDTSGEQVERSRARRRRTLLAELDA